MFRLELEEGVEPDTRRVWGYPGAAGPEAGMCSVCPMDSKEQVTGSLRGREATGGCELGRDQDRVGSAGKMGAGPGLDRSVTALR